MSNRYDSDFLSPWSSNDKIEIFKTHDNGVIDYGFRKKILDLIVNLEPIKVEYVNISAIYDMTDIKGIE